MPKAKVKIETVEELPREETRKARRTEKRFSHIKILEEHITSLKTKGDYLMLEGKRLSLDDLNDLKVSQARLEHLKELNARGEL